MAKQIEDVRELGRRLSVEEHDKSIMASYRKMFGQEKTACLMIRELVRRGKFEAWELEGEVYYAKTRN